MIPSGQSWQAETTSSCYSSFFGPSHSFINLLFLPLAPLTLTFCFLHLQWCTPSRCKPLCVSLLNSCSSFKHPPLSIFHCGSLILVLQLLLSLLSPWRLHQTNSIIKVKSELELWTLGFSPQGNFPSWEATVYTGRCSHTGTQGNTLQHTCKYTWMCVHAHTRTASRNFHLVYILSTLFFCNAKHRPCASCALQLWTMFVPDPNRRMKVTEDPSTFWFLLQGKIIIAPLGGPARSPEGPDRTRNVPQKPIKQQLFPVHHIKVWGMLQEREIETERKGSLKWSRGSVNLPPLVQFSRWPKFYTMGNLDGAHFITVESNLLKTGLVD